MYRLKSNLIQEFNECTISFRGVESQKALESLEAKSRLLGRFVRKLDKSKSIVYNDTTAIFCYVKTRRIVVEDAKYLFESAKIESLNSDILGLRNVHNFSDMFYRAHAKSIEMNDLVLPFRESKSMFAFAEIDTLKLTNITFKVLNPKPNVSERRQPILYATIFNACHVKEMYIDNLRLKYTDNTELSPKYYIMMLRDLRCNKLYIKNVSKKVRDAINENRNVLSSISTIVMM